MTQLGYERSKLKAMYSARVWDIYVDFMSDYEVLEALRMAREAKRREKK